MKKFLTVLLVIAVMFTFSFGSAFAAPPADMSKVITKADALNYAEKAYTETLQALEDKVTDLIKTTYGPYDADGYVDLTDSETISVSKASFLAAVAEDTNYKAAKLAIEDEYKRVVGKINEAAQKELFEGFVKDDAGTDEDYPGYTATYQFNTTVFDDSAFTLGATLDDKAAVKEFKTVKEEAIKAVSGIVLEGVYSKEYKNAEKSNYDKASELVNFALEDLDAVGKATAPTDIDSAATAVETIKDIYTAPVGKAKAKGALYTGYKADGTTPVAKYGTGLNGIVKIADEENTATDLAYAQNKVLSGLLSDLAKQKDAVVDAYAALLRNERDADKPNTDNIAKWTKEMADTEAAYNDAVAAITYLVKYTEETSELGTFSAGVFTPAGWSIGDQVTSGNKDLATFKTITITTTTYAGTPALTVAVCEGMAFEVAKAEKLAANDKIYINLDGSYAVQIDKALEKAIELIYTKNDTAANAYKRPTNTSELTARKKELIFEDPTANVNINGKKYETVNEWEAYADTAKNTYEKDQYDEIRAIVEETKDAIKAAATIADADAAFLAGYEKFDAIPTAQEHKNQFTLKSAFADKFDKYQEQFKAYVVAKDTTLGNLTVKDDYDYTVATLQDYFVKEWTGEFYKSVYTDADLDAKYAEALAVVDGLKTKAELKTQYEAVVTTINALPAAATVADKEAVKAARTAYDEYADYVDMIGAENVFTTKGAYVKVLDKLTTAEEAIKKAERKAIADAYKALPDVKKLTLADKAAVEAIREMLDAYVDSYVTKDASNKDAGSIDPKDSIYDLYLEAMGGSADKLSDFEDADGYEDVIAKEEIKYVEDLIAKLAVAPVDAAAVKAAREAYDAVPAYVFFDYGYDISDTAYDKLVALEKVVAVDVQALKITASSKATKGAITIKWTVKGNTTAADGYQIWKSTKKNSGFKKAFTTSKTTYKNTKGLKKGVKYYYKVRAYKVVDGKNVYSDWSNKAYRTAK